MTQKERILKALKAAGSNGIRPEDFLLPDVIDAGKPILRVASRINDLRKEGVRISTDTTGTTAIYRLVSPVEAVPSHELGGSSDREETPFDSSATDGAASSWFIEPDVVEEDLVWV